MLSRWLPWRWVVSRLARSRGFIDPVALLGRLQRFAQPSEVTEPIELLRAGVVFHARGLLNARAIQHNLDWVWPFWVERQFDPHDRAFVPRAFSITHVNLTHRNWTAVGLPDHDWLPLVDPHGLATPLFDGWSVDAWVLPEQGEALFPSRAARVEQRLLLEDGVAVETLVRGEGCELHNRVDVALEEGRPVCRMRFAGRAGQRGLLVLSVRPANPEGVSAIHDIHVGPDRSTLHVEGTPLHLDRPPLRICLSEYHRGDVLRHLDAEGQGAAVSCPVGLATAAALYPLAAGQTIEVTARVAMPGPRHAAVRPSWPQVLERTCALEVPDEKYRFLFDAAVRSLVLHSPGEVYPGPFTYKRFWFRDAAFLLEALLALGLEDRVARCLAGFPHRQDGSGYFRSQEGEWDSNGEALWILHRYHQLSGKALSEALHQSVLRGADWIGRKRLSDALHAPHAGLMPAGFSAEHLGLNDFYFWDDFWSAAGLRAAAALHPGGADAARWQREADRLLAAVDRAVASSEEYRRGRGMPASPYRRMDAGAIGNLAAGYPLRLWDAREPRLLRTLDYLMSACWVHGGFFQDMIHSGINAYLTLHAAQVLLRAGDPRYADLVRAVAELASPTGQWPEAIHPHTLGGCMGDGQHLWAAAEWVLMMKALFVREEGDHLVLGSGLPPAWLEAGTPLRLGPTLTPHGRLTIEVVPEAEGARLRWDADWHAKPPLLEVALPGHEVQRVDARVGEWLAPRTADTLHGATP